MVALISPNILLRNIKEKTLLSLCFAGFFNHVFLMEVCIVNLTYSVKSAILRRQHENAANIWPKWLFDNLSHIGDLSMKKIRAKASALLVVSMLALGVNSAQALTLDLNNPPPDQPVETWDFELNPLTPTVAVTNGSAIFSPQSSAGIESLDPSITTGVILEQSGSIVGFAQYGGVGYKLKSGTSYSAAAAMLLPDGTIVIGGYSKTSIIIPLGATKGTSLAAVSNAIRLIPGEMRFPKNQGTSWTLLSSGVVGRTVKAECQEQNKVTYGVAKTSSVSHVTSGYEETYNPIISVLGRDVSAGIRCRAVVIQMINGFEFSVPSSWNPLLWKI